MPEAEKEEEPDTLKLTVAEREKEGLLELRPEALRAALAELLMQLLGLLVAVKGMEVATAEAEKLAVEQLLLLLLPAPVLDTEAEASPEVLML